MAIQYESVARACVCNLAKRGILFNKSLLSRLVQEPSSYVVPGLRYEGKYKYNWHCTLLGRPVAGSLPFNLVVGCENRKKFGSHENFLHTVYLRTAIT